MLLLLKQTIEVVSLETMHGVRTIGVVTVETIVVGTKTLRRSAISVAH